MAAPIPLDAPVTIATLSLSVLIVEFPSHSSAIELPEKLSLSCWIDAPRSEIPTLARHRAAARGWQPPAKRLDRAFRPIRRGAGGRAVAGEPRAQAERGALAKHLPGAGQARPAHEGRAGGARADPGPRENRRRDDAPRARRGPHRKKGLHGRGEEAQSMKQERSPGTRR